jgi:hypothetical protein
MPSTSWCSRGSARSTGPKRRARRVRLPARSGRRISRVWDVAARTGAVAELGKRLAGPGADLTHECARYRQRLEKLLEDALIEISSVASTLDALSTRDVVEALIAGERNPRRLAELARGRMKAKRSELITALDGRLDVHHAELARMLLDQIDALTAQIEAFTGRIEGWPESPR